MKTILLFATMALLSITVFGQSAQTNAIPPAATSSDLVSVVTGSQGWLVAFFTIVGILRTCLKPIFSLLHKLAAATPSTADDQVVDRIERSGFVSAITYLLDWLTSIKIDWPARTKTPTSKG